MHDTMTNTDTTNLITIHLPVEHYAELLRWLHLVAYHMPLSPDTAAHLTEGEQHEYSAMQDLAQHFASLLQLGTAPSPQETRH